MITCEYTPRRGLSHSEMHGYKMSVAIAGTFLCLQLLESGTKNSEQSLVTFACFICMSASLSYGHFTLLTICPGFLDQTQ